MMATDKKMMLKEKVKNLPHTGGCYQFYDENNNLIYVGKAKNLYNRVSNYFNKVYDFKTTQLVSKIASINYILTSNEKESLLLEHNLIKNNRPRYNVLLNDDKTYPYIKITDERDPEYCYVRKIKKDKARYYGPFPDGTGAGQILKILQQLFPLRRCKGNLGEPCLYYHLQLCSGACFKEVPAEYYINMKRKIANFFHGKNKTLKNKILIRIKQASLNFQYEEAQRLKNVFDKLDFFISQQVVHFNDLLNRDFLGYVIKDNQLALTMLFYRGGQLLSKDEQIFTLFTDDITDAIRNYLQQLYTVNTVPEELYIMDVDVSDLAAVLKIKFISQITKRMQAIINLANKNATDLLAQQKVANYHIKYRSHEIITTLGQLLKIKAPYNIEILDIANLNNENVVGGVIVYQNGLPHKKLWRHYKIAIADKSDYHYLQNLIQRRFLKKITNNEPLPDLIIVDGGKAQISAVQQQLQFLQINLPVIGLVKNEHHKTSHLLDMFGKQVLIPVKSALFNWLVKVQEEVHRFTIAFHRKQRYQELFNNSLTAIPGLTAPKIKKLYQHFTTINTIQKASFEEINAIINNKRITTAILAQLNENQ